MKQNIHAKSNEAIKKYLAKKELEKTNGYFLVSVSKMSALDNYKEGQNPDTDRDHGIIHSFKAKSFEEILKQINADSAYIFDNRIDVQCQENDDGYAPTAKQLKDFEEGKTDLWACTYSYYISHVVETDLEHDDLKKAFPNLEVN